MIDFRYHLVSIVAVFLALATGIALGATTLSGQMIQRVQGIAETLSAENDKLRSQVAALRQQVEADQQLVSKVAPGLVDGQLDGQRVAVVQAPGASSQLRSRVVTMLERAGAAVSGRVSVSPKYLREDQAGVVGELATRLAAEGTRAPEKAPYERSAAVLARALMAGTTGGGDAAGTATVLSGFQTGGYLKVKGKPAGRATLAVVVAPNAPYKGRDAAPDNRAVIALARALDRYGDGAAVVGRKPATRPGGLVRALRGSGRAAETVSTVDFAGTATGRVVAVFALAREAAGKTGHYGVGPRAGSYLPPLSSLPGASAAAGQ